MVNNKIIGFTLSKKPINHEDVDVFSAGLAIKHKIVNRYHFYYWGIGNIEKCKIDPNTYTLSFPNNASLNDRNVLIKISNGSVLIENDWLGSIPIFYDSKRLVVSTLINKLLSGIERKLDSEGFNNYLSFGYSVFGLTPIEGVKFLRFYSKVIVGANSLSVVEKKDNVYKKLFAKSNSAQALAEIKKYIEEKEKLINGNIIIPTSGGYDSRLLNILVEPKKRIKSFTYGISKKQEESSEVVSAREVTKRLGVSWKQIPLGSFNKYYKSWFKLFGCSTHLHGMYHIEFYKKIKKIIGGDRSSQSLLSGIIGDAWSGNVSIPNIDKLSQLPLLAYSHGVSVDSSKSLLSSVDARMADYFLENREKLKSEKFRIISSMRIKIILLNYLVSIPDYIGMPSWTPFLNMNNALSMLNLPDELKKNRKWQEDFFKKHKLDVENTALGKDTGNVLDLLSAKVNPVEFLNIDRMSTVIDSDFLQVLKNKYEKLISPTDIREPLVNKLLKKRYIGPSLIKINIKAVDLLWPYYTLMILKSVDLTLEAAKK